MKDSRARYFANNLEELSRTDRIFLNNPVIMQGLGLAPVIVPARTLQTAFILAVGVTLMLMPTRVLGNIIGKKTGFKFHAVLYALISAVVFVAARYIMDIFFGLSLTSVGIYLPLLVLDPLIIKRQTNLQEEDISTSFRRGLASTAGFCLVLFLSAAAREVLAYGTLAGIEVVRFRAMPMADMAAGGFIVLGVLAAVWRAAANAFKRKVNMEA